MDSSCTACCRQTFQFIFYATHVTALQSAADATPPVFWVFFNSAFSNSSLLPQTLPVTLRFTFPPLAATFYSLLPPKRCASSFRCSLRLRCVFWLRLRHCLQSHQAAYLLVNQTLDANRQELEKMNSSDNSLCPAGLCRMLLCYYQVAPLSMALSVFTHGSQEWR